MVQQGYNCGRPVPSWPASTGAHTREHDGTLQKLVPYRSGCYATLASPAAAQTRARAGQQLQDAVQLKGSALNAF
jgi:hypothetical protein